MKKIYIIKVIIRELVEVKLGYTYNKGLEREEGEEN